MTKYLKVSAVSAALILSVTGCSIKNDSNEALNKKDQEIHKLTQELQAKDKQIASLENSSSNMQTITSSNVKDKNAVSNSLVPPNAKPGECYAKVLVPSKYETKTCKKIS